MSDTSSESTARAIIVGSDHAGLPLKEALLAALDRRGFEVRDIGTRSHASVDYPDFAHGVASAIESGDHALGILVCGSGVGMCITANKHPGVRAVVCSEPYSAAMARAHNDANVLCLGARVVGVGLAESILDAFLEGDFEGGRHARRVGKIESP